MTRRPVRGPSLRRPAALRLVAEVVEGAEHVGGGFVDGEAGAQAEARFHQAGDFAEEVDGYAAVNRCVRRYLGFFLAQLQFLIACNRHHTVEQRGARWLLSLQDRTGLRDLTLTQQHFADMLGITRQSADKVLTDFEAGNILDSRRGAVTIKDRPRLLDRVCDCYHKIASRLNGLCAV